MLPEQFGFLSKEIFFGVKKNRWKEGAFLYLNGCCGNKNSINCLCSMILCTGTLSSICLPIREVSDWCGLRGFAQYSINYQVLLVSGSTL